MRHILVLIATVLIVWTGTKTPGKVFVNTTDLKMAIKAAHRECPKARVVSVQRTKWGDEEVIALEFTGTCDVPVAGP